MDDTRLETLKPAPALFTSKGSEPAPGSPLPWVIAVAAVLILAALAVVATRRKASAPNAILPAAPYSSSLTLTDVVMSEASALSNVKVTYIDGHIRNNGEKTVKGAIAQVLFANDEQLPPQLESVPVTLIRTHEPYVDTEPMSASPLAPGEQREFRLIFENINSNWNQQVPRITITEVSTK